MAMKREEKLACIIALEHHKKKGAWGESALAKLLKELGLKGAKR